MRVLNIYKNFVYHLIFFILFISCKGYNIIVQDSFNIKAQNNIEEYNFNEIDLSNYRDSISSEMNQVINYSNINMNVGCPEGLLGNFITDLSILYLKKQININENIPDFCVFNNGGFRSSLNKGPVRISDIYEIMPFDNSLVILELNGDKMIMLLDYIKERSLYNSSRKSGVPVSGIRLKISGNKINRCFINTKEFNSNNKYRILTTDYLANGGDGMHFLKDCPLILDTQLLLRDVMINYIREIGNENIKLNAQLDGRIQINQ